MSKFTRQCESPPGFHSQPVAPTVPKISISLRMPRLRRYVAGAGRQIRAIAVNPSEPLMMSVQIEPMGKFTRLCERPPGSGRYSEPSGPGSPFATVGDPGTCGEIPWARGQIGPLMPKPVAPFSESLQLETVHELTSLGVGEPFYSGPSRPVPVAWARVSQPIPPPSPESTISLRMRRVRRYVAGAGRQIRALASNPGPPLTITPQIEPVSKFTRQRESPAGFYSQPVAPAFPKFSISLRIAWDRGDVARNRRQIRAFPASPGIPLCG